MAACATRSFALHTKRWSASRVVCRLRIDERTPRHYFRQQFSGHPAGPRRAAFGEWIEGRVLAGQRPSSPTAATSLLGLNLRLLRNLQSIVNLDAEIPDSA